MKLVPALAAAMVLVLLAACGGGEDERSEGSTRSTTEAERSATTTAAVSATSSSTTLGSPSSGGPPTTGGPDGSDPPSGPGGRTPSPERTDATTSAVPVTDAARARDAVLFVAEQAPYSADQTPALAVVGELVDALPGLVIDDAGAGAASSTSLSIESSFLITDAGPTVLGFAIADTAGRCAGGVIGARETSAGSYRYESVPTLFETVDTTGITTCDGATVRQLWDTRHGHR